MINRVRSCKCFLGLLGLLSLSMLLGGCGGTTPESALRDANRTNIQRLANLYTHYQFSNKFQGPADETAFREFIQGPGRESLEKMGITMSNLDDLFINERDGETFKIRYGVPTSTRGSKEPVIFESTGKGGKRMVAFLNMVQREVDAAEYDQLWNAKPATKPDTGDRMKFDSP